MPFDWRDLDELDLESIKDRYRTGQSSQVMTDMWALIMEVHRLRAEIEYLEEIC